MNIDGDPPVSDSPDAPRYPFWGYDDVGIFVGMVLPAVLLSVLIIAGGGAIAPGFFRRPVVQSLGSQVLTYLFVFGGLRLLFRARYDRPLLGSLAWILSPARTIWPILAGPVLAISIGALGLALKAPVVRNPFEGMMKNSAEIAAVGIFAVLLGPLAEELSFRGFLLPLLARSIGPAAGVTATALAFGLLHGPQYSWAWQHVVLVGLTGVTLGVVRLWTGSTASAFLMHATYNMTFFAAFLLQTQFTRNGMTEPI